MVAAQIVRPIDHRRQTLRSGQAEPDAGGLLQAPPLDNRVGEVGGADHHAADLLDVKSRLVDQVLQSAADAIRNVRGGGGFSRSDDRAAIHQHGIRISAAYVNSNAHR